MEQKLMRISEVKKILGMSRPQIDKLIKHGHLHCHRLNGKGWRRFSASEVCNYIENMFGGPHD